MNLHLNSNRARNLRLALLCLLALARSGAAQQATPGPSAPPPAAPTVILSPAPAASATPAAVPAPAAPAATTPSAPPAPAASPTPSLLKKTGVKIQFVPPPMDGTVSLGIYDSGGKLVRILHREASGDEFVAALDGYITHWDGLDDAGKPLPPGRYSAKGYMVGAVTVRKAADAPVQSATGAAIVESGSSFKFADGTPFAAQEKIHVGLVANPLEQDRAGSAEVSVGYDAMGSWLQLADGLPLKQISATPNLKWAVVGRSAPGQPLVVFQGNGAAVEEFLITKAADMMAFDCGGFDLAAPSH